MFLRILQIGCGNIGGVIAKITLANAYGLHIVDKNQLNFSAPNHYRDILSVQNNDFDIILLAIKPQDFTKVINEIKALCGKQTNIVSIMAGISMQKLQETFPNAQGFARLMPNLGLESGYGITLVLDKTRHEKVDNFIKSVFASSGNIALPVQSDDEIARLTPFTGSGAALFLKLADILAKELAKESKIPASGAQKITLSVLGQSLDMAKTRTFDEAIKKIASKGGITQAMLDTVLIDIENSLSAGQKRANELEKSL